MVGVMTGSTRRVLTIVAAVVAVALLAAGVMFSERGGDGASSDGASESGAASGDAKATEEEVGLVRRDADEVTAMGDEDAPVVLIEYSDFRCPFCGAFARDTMPELKKKYVDTGKLRVEWRDFPLFGDESMDGAMAARAAGEQDKFWEYHDAMYADAPERGHLKITDDQIMDWAEEVGIEDMEKFEKDLEDSDLRASIEADGQEAASAAGATGTPAFVIGDQRLAGAQPLETFTELIDEELEAAGES